MSLSNPVVPDPSTVKHIYPARLPNESKAAYSRRTGLCFHRMKVMHKIVDEENGRVILVEKCRWCSRSGWELVVIVSNRLSVSVKNNFQWLDTTKPAGDISLTPLSPTDAPQELTPPSQGTIAH